MASLNQKSKLNDILKEHKAPNDPTHTHVSMGVPRGVYSIGTKMKDFWSCYLKAMELGQSVYIAESPGKEIPILVDVDLRVKKSTLSESSGFGKYRKLYDLNKVIHVVRVYQDAINEVVQKLRDDAYICILLEKEPYECEIAGEIYVKNGFHLHFPKIFLDTKVQEVYLIPIIKKKLEAVQLFADIGVQDFIDTNSLNVHWLMYGSRKPNGKPYKATMCFGKNAKEISFEEALSDYQCNQYYKETMADIDCHNRVIEMMPRILSISLHDRVVYHYHPKDSIITPLMESSRKIRDKRKPYDQLSVDKLLEDARLLIDMIDISRSDDRATWLRIGYCLWNITNGDDEGLTLWLAFSEKSEKFKECECMSLWFKHMKKNNFTIGTLKYYARQDSPEEYDKMVKSKTNHLVVEAINGCHNDVAKILFNEYGNEFVCTSIANKEWYQFKSHVWKQIDKGTTLRERISSEDGIMLRLLHAKLNEYRNQFAQLTEEEQSETKKEHEKCVKKVYKLIDNCKNTPYKNHVMVECCEIFYNPDFFNMLNKDPYIVACENGVFDFVNMVFRDGNPEDYLSIALPFEYIDFKSIDHPRVIEVDDFFQKVFPDREVRDYFLDQMCQVFVGGNHNKIMLFWVGEGNNGKTVTQTLFEKMMGRLAIKFNTTLLTGKKIQSGAANPELARAGDGVRWAVMEEPNADEVISSGILKALTGNDSFWARDLFQKGKDTREIRPYFKLAMICNNPPTIKDADKATWNRIRVIPFESTFLPENECPFDIEEQCALKQFPMDKNFSDRIPNMIQALAWYLIQRYKTINKLEQIEPDKVKMATDNYQRDNDIFKQFGQQCVIESNGSKLTPTTLYTYFKEWIREECPNHTIPNRAVVTQHFTKIWGSLEKGKHWVNKMCKLPCEEDDEE